MNCRKDGHDVPSTAFGEKPISKPPTLQSLKMAIAEGLEGGESELLEKQAIKAEARRALLDACR